jgi:hypothetical protein
MTIQIDRGAFKRRTLSLPFGGRKHMGEVADQAASILTPLQLQRLVAAMVD